MPSRTMYMPSKRLILSYVFDWIIILAMAGLAGSWNFITPYKRPISLVDLTISFPFQTKETVPFWLAVVVAMVFPAAVIFFVSLIFIPGPTANKRTPKALIWRRKLWEWNTGWMGLGLSLATAFLITQGLKNLVGKARPDLLSRCKPDIANFKDYVLGGYGGSQDLSPFWVRVSADICTSTDTDTLNDGFRSWPSGHASFSWAGLLYLSLFLCAKFAIAIPFLPPRSYSQDTRYTALEEQELSLLPTYKERTDPPLIKPTSDNLSANTSVLSDIVPIRNQAAAPPNWLLILALAPSCGAAYIAASRYVDFRHHAIDIVSGSVIGIVCAWFSFRWYHLPIRQGAGWSWGARSRDRAFGIGVGRGTYVGLEGWISKKNAEEVGETSLMSDRTDVAEPPPGTAISIDRV